MSAKLELAAFLAVVIGLIYFIVTQSFH